MVIIEIVIKGLSEAVNPRRFLPFFLLYLLFFTSVLVFASSLLQVLPSLILLQFTEKELAIAMVNIVALLIVFLIVIGINLWFTGALVFDLYKNKGFDLALKYSKKFYLKMIFLSFLLFLFIIFSGLFGDFSLIIRLLIDWIFMFSLVAIIIKGDGVQQALTRSYNIIRKNILKTFGFLILTYFITFLILFFSIFLVVISMYPLFLNLAEIAPAFTNLKIVSSQQLTRIIALILRSYPSLVIASVIASLFFSFANVFIYSSRTYYFLSLKKK